MEHPEQLPEETDSQVEEQDRPTGGVGTKIKYALAALSMSVVVTSSDVPQEPDQTLEQVEYSAQIGVSELAEDITGIDRVTMATANLGNGQLILGQSINLNSFKDKLMKIQPDVLAMQEVRKHDLEQLDAFGPAIFAETNDYIFRGPMGIALAFKPGTIIEEYEIYDLKDAGRWTDRKAIFARVRLPGREDSINILTAHLSPKMAKSQAKELRRIIDEREVNWFLGDTNLSTENANEALGVSNNSQFLPDELDPPTYPSDNPRQKRIDRIIALSALPLMQYIERPKVELIESSDHKMLVYDMETGKLKLDEVTPPDHLSSRINELIG
ncbi:endonuclease/exonuclease/phosphatase family protein [Candidatus Saccharibacteria bacterium]|jgi:endonuclease/exonuclease/phosphatase family metal-dependent hydrolase|nr:endonuclease/exonuclease/phosphatase family protein [Candidatus Saccharibacteria bacterium]MBP9131752.1 endonuclease/exonuclease/phosphatase family protein [Candidatus Saccharibacteria bacterium]